MSDRVSNFRHSMCVVG